MNELTTPCEYGVEECEPDDNEPRQMCEQHAYDWYADRADHMNDLD
jgi:hypothetical protein